MSSVPAITNFIGWLLGNLISISFCHSVKFMLVWGLTTVWKVSYIEQFLNTFAILCRHLLYVIGPIFIFGQIFKKMLFCTAQCSYSSETLPLSGRNCFPDNLLKKVAFSLCQLFGFPVWQFLSHSLSSKLCVAPCTGQPSLQKGVTCDPNRCQPILSPLPAVVTKSWKRSSTSTLLTTHSNIS